MPENSSMPRGSFVSGGNINPSRFVYLSDEFTVLECGSANSPRGISQEGQKLAPISGNSTVAAASGDPLAVYLDGQFSLLECGSTVTAGDKLKPDADGKGVTATTEDYGALALESGTTNEKIKVIVHIGETA